jgi:hypothetical protein
LFGVGKELRKPGSDVDLVWRSRGAGNFGEALEILFQTAEKGFRGESGFAEEVGGEAGVLLEK